MWEMKGGTYKDPRQDSGQRNKREFIPRETHKH